MECLNIRRHDTYRNLASEFGVSIPTIQRDIKRLEADYPLITVQGRHDGGVKVMEGCRADRMYLDRGQQELLERLLGILAKEDAPTMQEILRKFALKH